MAQGSNDTLASWGTADANALYWRDTMIAMMKEILQEHGRVSDIAAKYGFQFTDWGAKAKLRTSDKRGFIG